MPNYERMFNAACVELGKIGKVLKLDPDASNGSAEIIDEIRKLQSLAAAPTPPVAQVDEFRYTMEIEEACREAAPRVSDTELELIFMAIRPFVDSLASQPAALTPTAEQASVRSDENRRDAERYRWWRENINLILEDGDGLPGVAYSHQVPLTILAGPLNEMFDAVADAAMSDNQESSK